MYKLTTDPRMIVRIEDNVWIPIDIANTEYQAYLAWVADGNEVAYDLQEVTAQAEADAQAIIDTKASALAKLSKLGLTEDEIKALVG